MKAAGEVEEGRESFQTRKSSTGVGAKVRQVPLVETRVTAVVESVLWSPFLSVEVPTWCSLSLSLSVCLIVTFCSARSPSLPLPLPHTHL